MRKIVMALAAILFTAGVTYADNAATPQLDAFLKLTTLTADFVQVNHYSGLDNFTYKGKVYISRPQKALWDYSDPVEYYILEPGKITHYSASLNQLIKMKVDTSKTTDANGVLLGVFLDSSRVKSQFNATEAGDKITLKPKTDLGVEHIVIEMNKGLVESIFSVDKSGNSISIKFSNVKQGEKIDQSVFKKTVPEGTQIFEQ